MTTGLRIGVDIGGTFTDLVLSDNDGRTWCLKCASTPDQLERAVLSGVQSLLKAANCGPEEVVEVLHGTTVGSNTLLEHRGATTGLITTKGFRDVLEIGRVRTPDMFDLQWEKPAPLVPRRLRQEVSERIAADGEIVTVLNENELYTVAAGLLQEGVVTIAVCFINSFRNPVHEVCAEQLLREWFPDTAVTTSVSVLAEMREYERTSTTVVNAYVLPVLRYYLQRLEDGLRTIGIEAPLLVSDSNGGLATAKTAREKPVFFISSGRSAGVAGAARLGRSLEQDNIVVFDMGGTTASASLVRDGTISRANEYEFRSGISTPARFIKAGGYMMRVPTIDVAEVGSGGGSIAWIDEGGLLCVGPRSSGAIPGPACYGHGGMKPTVSDANAVLGYLPKELAGGTLTLDIDLARQVIADGLASPLGLSIEDAAYGVREVTNAKMAGAIRAVSVERGIDARDFTLVAFGGSGPIHACDLARSLDIRRVLLPVMPGVFTALGMLTSDVERHFLTAMPSLLKFLSIQKLKMAAQELKARAKIALEREDISSDLMSFSFTLEMRFEGQDSEIPVLLSQDWAEITIPWLEDRYLQAYRQTYQYAAEDSVEVVNLRLLARGARPDKLDFATLSLQEQKAEAGQRNSRQVYFSREEGWVETPVIDRRTFVGTSQGPMILESADSTIAVPPAGIVEGKGNGNLTISLPGEGMKK